MMRIQIRPHSFFTVFLLVVAVSVIGACSNIERHSNHEPQVVAAPDNVSAMLASAADRASGALERLAAIETTRTPATNVGPIGNAPSELRRAITINWIGPVEPITDKLANRAGYTFSVIGPQPPTPVVVSIDAENRPVIEVLRDIGLQLGTRGDVKVDGQGRKVEIHYPANDG